MRAVHRTHRLTGTLMALLLAIWFASGAVMTFARYPAYTQEERLASRSPIAAAAREPVQVPPGLSAWLVGGGLASGARARLGVLERKPTWTFAEGERQVALRTQAPFAVGSLGDGRIRAEVSRRLGPCRGSVTDVERPDQWTVGRSHPGHYPLARVVCDDAEGREVYVSRVTGEIVQVSTRGERIGAWLGAIPHWIYPAVLRRERGLWRTTVLWLAAIGLVVSMSGLAAGVHAYRARRRAARRESGLAARDPYLRWHQRLGLGFGALATTWLLSGALSLSPFQWTGSGLSTRRQASLYDTQLIRDGGLPVASALSQCDREIDTRELELAALGRRVYAVCSDAAGHTRIVDFHDPELRALKRISNAQLHELAAALSDRYDLAIRHAPDSYYYPTHSYAEIALPYATIELPGTTHAALYVDPARASVVRYVDDRRRLERWLYNGLHSLDFPLLYEHRGLWRAVVISAMAVGFALSALGVAIFTRRQRRRVTRSERASAAAHSRS